MNIWKYATIDDMLEGGKADNKSIDIPKDELEKGLKVESEHSNNPAIQKEIVNDHEVEAIEELSGEPNYYEYLEDMEEQMKNDRKSSYVEFSPNYVNTYIKKVNKPTTVNIPYKSNQEQHKKQKKKHNSDSKFENMLDREIYNREFFASNIDELLKYADTLGIKLLDDLSNNLETIYEWEYKFHKINNSESTNEKRKNFALKRINLELNPVLNKVIQDLSNVYQKWLDNHALLSPRTWAVNRIKEFKEMEELDLLMGNMESEYNRYVNTEKSEFDRDFIETNKDLIIPYLKEIMNDEINSYTNELEDAKYRENEADIQEFTERINTLNERLDNPDNMNSFEIEDYIYTFYESLDSFFKNVKQNDLEEMAIRMYEEIIFPAWYGHWQEKDIDTIRANNENIYNQLQSADNLNDKFKIINIALNGVHVTGDMTDYISEIDSEINTEFLSRLSNLDTAQWDKDLTLLGIH
jgi:hypothetical protein